MITENKDGRTVLNCSFNVFGVVQLKLGTYSKEGKKLDLRTTGAYFIGCAVKYKVCRYSCPCYISRSKWYRTYLPNKTNVSYMRVCVCVVVVVIVVEVVVVGYRLE